MAWYTVDGLFLVSVGLFFARSICGSTSSAFLRLRTAESQARSSTKMEPRLLYATALRGSLLRASLYDSIAFARLRADL